MLDFVLYSLTPCGVKLVRQSQIVQSLILQLWYSSHTGPHPYRSLPWLSQLGLFPVAEYEWMAGIICRMLNAERQMLNAKCTGI